MTSHGSLLTGTILIVMALHPGGQQSPGQPDQAASFIGKWAVTMTEPEALKGSQQTVRIWNDGGAIAASLQVGTFPPIRATGIHKDGDMLVLTISHDAKPALMENGAPIWAVISLTLDGATIRTAQMLERSQTIKRGTGTKQPE